MKKAVLILTLASVIFSVSALLLYSSHSSRFLDLTGHAGSSGSITIFVEPAAIVVKIYSPVNGTTYNFNYGSNYTIDLNVTAANQNIISWWYTLLDLRHGTTAADTVYFTPNATFNAARWNNRIIVYAKSDAGYTGSASADFYIHVPSVAPILSNLSRNISVCEESALSVQVNVTDPDEDNISLFINPQNPFFITPAYSPSATLVKGTIFSGNLGKAQVGSYPETITTSDGTYADIKYTNITVIEINNPPVIDNLTVQTVWDHGDNNSFNRQVNVNDAESGNSSSGKITFNLTFLSGNPFFNISRLGVINFTANSSEDGVYNLSICATDTGIKNISPNITLCGQDGKNITSCMNFSITVTNENRQPYFVSYSPLNLTFNSTSDDNLQFNVTTHDPDGTVPDIYWYVDSLQSKYMTGNISDEFDYNFGCGISGKHNVTVQITDGLLNNSIEWDINLKSVSCFAAPFGLGLGGAGGGKGCTEKWVCYDWDSCQNLDATYKSTTILKKDYSSFQSSCAFQGLDKYTCGFQIRNCFDLSNCKTNYSMPYQSQTCYYTSSPSCNDGIKNCHDGQCEVLTDCGGPCSACATCSDKIQNQGELGIDCGGPCPNRCPEKQPLIQKEELKYITYLAIIIILIVLIVVIVVRIIKILKIRKEIKELKWYRL